MDELERKLELKTVKIEIITSKTTRIKKKTSQLLEFSTSHGIPNIIRSKNLIILIMWSAFTILSICVGSYFVIESILNYLKYNTITNIDIIDETEAIFPALTFCGYPSLETHLNETIISVSFQNLDETNNSLIFQELTDNRWGRCFRYNSGKEKKSRKIGKKYGFKLHMYLKNSYDLSEILLFIHNQTSEPFDEDNGGYWIRPGSWNYFELNRIYYNRLGEPFNNCLKDVNLFDSNQTLINIIVKSNRTYSQQYCYYLCLNLFALEENSCSQYCPLECDSMSYEVNNYLELMPDNGSISNATKLDLKYLNQFETYEQVNKHLVAVRVYYKNLKYTLISEEPKAELFNFISNIGGILGLFIGISFLSLIEIFEIIIEISIILFSK